MCHMGFLLLDSMVLQSASTAERFSLGEDLIAGSPPWKETWALIEIFVCLIESLMQDVLNTIQYIFPHDHIYDRQAQRKGESC